jgi:integrase
MPERRINKRGSGGPKSDGMTISSDLESGPRRTHPPAYLSESELRRLMAVIASPSDRAIFSVAYHRGLRASEIGLLQYRDYTPPTINERAGKLYVRRLKDSDSKIYQLTKSEHKDLRTWLRIRGDWEGPLFPSAKRGPLGIRRSMLDELMKRYGKAAGLPPELRFPRPEAHLRGTPAPSSQQPGGRPGAGLARPPEHPEHHGLPPHRQRPVEGGRRESGELVAVGLGMVRFRRIYQ